MSFCFFARICGKPRKPEVIKNQISPIRSPTPFSPPQVLNPEERLAAKIDDVTNAFQCIIQLDLISGDAVKIYKKNKDNKIIGSAYVAKEIFLELKKRCQKNPVDQKTDINEMKREIDYVYVPAKSYRNLVLNTAAKHNDSSEIVESLKNRYRLGK